MRYYCDFTVSSTSSRPTLTASVILLLIVAILCVSTRAKLSVYENLDPATRVCAQSTKLSECRMDPVSVTPLTEVVMILVPTSEPPVLVEVRPAPPIRSPHYDRSLFLRPPPARS
ncbi:MAG: hypothetical protein ABI823_13495 [Bryobacteraceae bacterium]